MARGLRYRLVGDRPGTRRIPAAVLVLVSVFWPLALLGAPRTGMDGPGSPASYGLASGVYVLGSRVCHQRSDRSFHVRGVQFPVCARCLGLYVAAPFGVVGALVASRRRRPLMPDGPAWRWALVAAALPTAATLAWEAISPGTVSGAVRAGAGAPLGFALGALAAVASVGKSG